MSAKASQGLFFKKHYPDEAEGPSILNEAELKKIRLFDWNSDSNPALANQPSLIKMWYGMLQKIPFYSYRGPDCGI